MGEDNPNSAAGLNAQKKNLKARLKEYDMSFVAKNGRMPVKAEKEPIRHLYEEYNRVKGLLSKVEENVALSPGLSAVAVYAKSPVQQAAKSAATVPTTGSEKATLHAQLRSYEKEFAKKNGRQVASFADIKPVADLYRRYKEIKKAGGA